MKSSDLGMASGVGLDLKILVREGAAIDAPAAYTKWCVQSISSVWQSKQMSMSYLYHCPAQNHHPTSTGTVSQNQGIWMIYDSHMEHCHACSMKFEMTL